MKRFLKHEIVPGILLSAWAISIFLAAQAQAYNGKVALVYPVENIVIDGDLSDWPEDDQKHSILLPEFGVKPHNTEDFQAFFQLGYNKAENAFYVAVEVHDDSIVANREDGFWDNQDGCEIFFYLGSQIQMEEATVIEPFVAMRQYVLWGLNETQRHFPLDVRKEVVLAFQRRDHTHRYEWKLDVGAMSQDQLQLGPEMDFGFDIAVNDMDADSTLSWLAWGPGTNKRESPERVGQVVLLERGASLESLLDTFLTTRSTADLTVRKTRVTTSYQMFCSGILLAFTVVHFLLFAFYPRLRANLYYALFTSSIAACIFFGFQWDVSTGSDLIFALFLTLALFLEGVLGLLFLYSLFYQRLPRRFWFFLAVLLCDAAFTLSIARQNMNLLETSDISYPMIWPSAIAVMLLVFAETIRLVVVSIHKKKEGAWIVGVGFIGFVIANTRLIFIFIIEQYGLDNITLPGPSGDSGLLLLGDIDMTVILGLVFPLIAMSINLARSFGRIHRDLEVQLVQVRDLSVKTQEQNRELEEANRQIQEANRLKSDFLARMSHDLRTPMNAIIGYTRILLRRTRDALDERQYRNLENVQTSADNLLTLINDILDLSKIESGRLDIHPENVDLQQVLDECATSVQSLVKEGVELRQEIGAVAALYTDPDRLRRVVMNLLSNAVKFTEAGHILLALRSTDDGVEIAVSDTGVGIPAEDLPHIFDEFRQVDGADGSRQEGTGLGLAIVKKSMELLSGSIAVESEVGKGTTFIMQLKDCPSEDSAANA